MISTSVLTRLRNSPAFNTVSASRQLSKTMERLPQLNYSLLKDTALRKKLSELGIPSGGSKALLIRRHTEWVNLVNANCDSNKPRTKRDLLHELEIWDKTQGRQIMTNSSGTASTTSVMNKDFDGVAWAASHDNDFKTLIAKARERADPQTEEVGSADSLETPVPAYDAGDEFSPIAPDSTLESTISVTNYPSPKGENQTRLHSELDHCQTSQRSVVDLSAEH